jgi:xanthine dehydrogenase large subunit
MIAICAHELGVSPESIRIMHTATDKVPNTSATAASAGSDLNGQAVADACRILRARMVPVAAELLGVDGESLTFVGDAVGAPGAAQLSFREVAAECWLRQIPLSATGFYTTPGIAYDAELGQGTPFYYYAYGGAVIEVEVSAVTGEHRILRADILHDVGASLVPSIDIGQVEGAFAQGLGWLMMEEVLFDGDGRALTTGPSTYKIPAVGDIPLDLRVKLLDRAPQPGVIHGSKAVGEPPFMLAIGVVSALRHAIGAFAQGHHEVKLDPPCTPEAVLRSIEEIQGRASAAENPDNENP